MWEELHLYCIFHACVVILLCVLQVSPHNCSATLPSLHGGVSQFLRKALPSLSVKLGGRWARLACPFLHNQAGKGVCRGYGTGRGGGGRQTLLPSLERCSGARSWESFLGSCFPNCQCSGEPRVFVVVLFFSCLQSSLESMKLLEAFWGMQLVFANPLRAGGSVDCPSTFVPPPPHTQFLELLFL